MKEINRLGQKVWKALHFAIVRMLSAENFDRHVTQTLCKNYTRQDFVQQSRAFESIGIASCMCGVSEFNVGQVQTQREKLS